MPRARSPNRDKAFRIWKESKGEVALKDIAEQLGVKDTQVRKWKNQDKWEEQLKGTLPKKKGNVTRQEKEQVKDISWVDIENEYVTDIRKKPCNLESLAEKYGIAIQTIYDYSAAHEWSRKRKEYKELAKEKAREKAAELISNDIAKAKAIHFQVSNKILLTLMEALDDDSELYKYVEKLRTGYGMGDFREELVTETLDALNDAKLLNMVNSLEKLQKMQRQTLGILDEKDAEKLNLDKAKLLLDVEKAKGENKSNQHVDALKKKMAERKMKNGSS